MKVNLNNLHKATRQDVFDTVCRALKKQEFEQSIIDGCCQYRGLDGKRCAAGALMTDVQYGRLCKNAYSVEGQGWDSLSESSVVPSDHSRLIYDLQGAHDNGTAPDDMRFNLLKVADAYGLNTKVLGV